MELRWVLVKGEARTSVRLAPGRYSVKPMGVGYRPVEVDVGDRMVELELAPER